MAKVLVSLDDRLLAKIDREAKRRAVSRSALLGRILEERFSKPDRRRAELEETLRELQELVARNPVPEDATAAIRAERDARANRSFD